MLTAFETETTVERRDDLLRDDQTGAILGLVGRGREVRRGDDFVQLQQRPRIGLLREHVECGAGELARANRFLQGLLVDELTARGVDETGTVAHLRDRVASDQATGLVGERGVQRDDVRGSEHPVERLRALDAEVAEALLGDERVVRNDTHAQADGAARDLLADPSEPDHSERLAFQLDPVPARTLPAALLERRVGLRDVASESDDQSDRLLGSGDDGRLGRVRDDDAPPGGGFDIDVVDAHAGPPDHLEALASLDQVRRQLRRRPDDDPVVAPDDPRQVAVAVDIDLETRAQEIDSRLGDRLPDENSHAAVTASAYASSARVTAAPRSICAPMSARTSSTAASAVVMSKTSNQPM